MINLLASFDNIKNNLTNELQIKKICNHKQNDTDKPETELIKTRSVMHV
jgi:hypothetical protein